MCTFVSICGCLHARELKGSWSEGEWEIPPCASSVPPDPKWSMHLIPKFLQHDSFHKCRTKCRELPHSAHLRFLWLHRWCAGARVSLRVWILGHCAFPNLVGFFRNGIWSKKKTAQEVKQGTPSGDPRWDKSKVATTDLWLLAFIFSPHDDIRENTCQQKNKSLGTRPVFN